MSDIRNSAVVFVNTSKNGDYVAATPIDDDDAIFVNLTMIRALDEAGRSVLDMVKQVMEKLGEN